jgi:hypothetical protein
MRNLWLFTFLGIVGFSSATFGWGGKLSNPEFGYRGGLDANRQKKAAIASKFMTDELKFIDGQFINQFVTNRFGGTSQQTSRLIELLNDADAWKVRVQFQDLGEQDSALSLWQNMASDEVVVTVNSGRNDFRLKDFQAYLPKPPLPANAKQPAKK